MTTLKRTNTGLEMDAGAVLGEEATDDQLWSLLSQLGISNQELEDIAEEIGRAEELESAEMPVGQMIGPHFAKPALTQYLATGLRRYQGATRRREAEERRGKTREDIAAGRGAYLRSRYPKATPGAASAPQGSAAGGGATPAAPPAGPAPTPVQAATPQEAPQVPGTEFGPPELDFRKVTLPTAKPRGAGWRNKDYDPSKDPLVRAWRGIKNLFVDPYEPEGLDQ